MNIHHLIEAVRSLESAEIATINPAERNELAEISKSVRRILRKHGVWIGGNLDESKQDTQS